MTALATRLADPPAPPLPDAEETRRMLRLIACGSVDDGKSTLLGRLLYDGQAVFIDQLATLSSDSRRFGTAGDETDFALLLDGLEAEREQGITIDVAYRYFSTPTRKVIIADTPGHEQYTRNMVTGASTADLAIVLIDATQGVLRQTRRHSEIVRLLGIPNIVVAINKMDLVDFDSAVFDRLVADYRELAGSIGIAQFTAIPIVARDGDHIVKRSERLGWYTGPTVLEALEAAEPRDWPADAGFAMPVQFVSRPDHRFRGYAGRVAGGRIAPGDAVRILPSGITAHIDRIVTPEGDLSAAIAGQSAMITLAERVDCARGDVIVGAESTAVAASVLEATLVWFGTRVLAPGQRYLLKLGARTVPARVTELLSAFDPETGDKRAVATAGLNDIVTVRLVLEQPLVLDRYAASRMLGAFILIDPSSNATLAGGMVESIDQAARPDQSTGASIHWIDADAATKPLLAAKALRLLRAQGRPVCLLDEAALGELNANAAGAESTRRANAVANLMRNAGITVVIALAAEAHLAFAGTPLTAADLEESQIGNWVI
ncbi:MAG: hypothetical protein B7Y45_11180 [Sphingomonas sp. 28-66-16]|nr:MAG: hypothetical protein B7Y45_11180 [Sphingomonas sp. 28-66-16]